LAALLVPPPDLMDPAQASAPRIKETGPEGLQPTIADLVPSDVEPDWAVEGRDLVQQDVGQLGLKSLAVLICREVATLPPPLGDSAGHSRQHLLDAALTLGRTGLTPEILLCHDVGGILAPRLRKFDIPLLEGHLLTLADPRVASFPFDRVERIHARLAEIAPDRKTLATVTLADCSLGCVQNRHCNSFPPLLGRIEFSLLPHWLSRRPRTSPQAPFIQKVSSGQVRCIGHCETSTHP
jgi:hypothetical protein